MERFEGGFPLELFVFGIHPAFLCQICNLVVRNPKECLLCKNVCCESCIRIWSKQSQFCPYGCKNPSLYFDFIYGTLNKIYQGLRIKCERCPATTPIVEYNSHKAFCSSYICFNWKQCKKSIREKFGYCSPNCVQAVLKRNKQEDYSLKEKVSKANCENVTFAWRRVPDSKLSLNDEGSIITKYPTTESFESVLGKDCLKTGLSYWELKIEALAGCTVLIGVCVGKSCAQNSVFCYDNGFAFTSNGRAVDKERFSGIRYGSPFGAGTTVGVLNDSDLGALSFFMDGSISEWLFVVIY